MTTASSALSDRQARTLLRNLLDAALAAADPYKCIGKHLPDRWDGGRVVVVGAGKASAAMAAAVEHLRPGLIDSGVVAVPYGYSVATSTVKVVEAGHPVPDENSEHAAQSVLSAVAGLTANDLVIALISGGGSAAMALPRDGLSLAEKQTVNRLLLASGLDIRTINAVRRRLSAIKGGKLAAAAAPAQILSLAISDIPGDDIAAIASGPTIPCHHGTLDLADVIARLGSQLPAAALRLLNLPEDGAVPLGANRAELICTPMMALEAAARLARDGGCDVRVLGDAIEGESADLGVQLAHLAKRPVERPTVYLSGGETTVTITRSGGGRGGRNTEFALALALALEGHPRVWAVAADTDGQDGSAPGIAGAIVAPDTISRAVDTGIDPVASLAGHDSASFFESIGDAVVTGPTFTNVNDFRAILVLPD